VHNKKLTSTGPSRETIVFDNIKVAAPKRQVITDFNSASDPVGARVNLSFSVVLGYILDAWADRD